MLFRNIMRRFKKRLYCSNHICLCVFEVFVLLQPQNILKNYVHGKI